MTTTRISWSGRLTCICVAGSYVVAATIHVTITHNRRRGSWSDAELFFSRRVVAELGPLGYSSPHLWLLSCLTIMNSKVCPGNETRISYCSSAMILLFSPPSQGTSHRVVSRQAMYNFTGPIAFVSAQVAYEAKISWQKYRPLIVYHNVFISRTVTFVPRRHESFWFAKPSCKSSFPSVSIFMCLKMCTCTTSSVVLTTVGDAQLCLNDRVSTARAGVLLTRKCIQLLRECDAYSFHMTGFSCGHPHSVLLYLMEYKIYPPSGCVPNVPATTSILHGDARRRLSGTMIPSRNIHDGQSWASGQEAWRCTEPKRKKDVRSLLSVGTRNISQILTLCRVVADILLYDGSFNPSLCRVR